MYYLVKVACFFVVFDCFLLRCDSCLPFGWLVYKRAARVEDNILMAFLYWVVNDSSPPLTFRL